MSGESAPKPRLVLCPKCRQLLPESPDFDVYKCGGCGTTLQAKRRKSRAVNSESRSHETDAAPRNVPDLVSDGKQNSKGEQLVSPQENVLREKATSSSSGECSLEGNDVRGQIENGESNGEQRVASQENGLRAKANGSSSGECSLEGNSGRGQIENGGCNAEQLVTSQENGLKEKTTSSSTGESSLVGNGGRGQIENGECSEEQPVISQENDLRAKATSSSSEECSLDGNGGRSQIENGEYNVELPVISQENDLSDLRTKATSSSSGECSLNGNGGRGQTENGKCIKEKLGPFNLSDEEPENVMDIYTLSDTRRHTESNKGCSNELPCRGIEASAELMADNSVEKANDTNLQLEGEELSNGNVPLEGAGEQLIRALDIEDANDEKSALVGVKSEVDNAGSDSEVEEELNDGNLLQGAEQKISSGSNGEYVNNDKLALVGAGPEEDVNGTNKAESKELNNGNLLLEGTEEGLNMCASDGADPKNGQSALVGTKSEVDITGNASTVKRSSTETFVSEKGSISHVSPHKLQEGTSDNHVSSPRNIHHSFDHIRSPDAFDNTEVNNPSSEISGALREFSKSPTTRSSHAYDGSISSNDGMDERFPGQHLYSFENIYTVANGSEGGSRKGKGLVNSMLYGDLETQHQSYFPNRKYHVLKDSRGNQNEVLETTRHGPAHWMRTKKDEFPFQMPLHRSGSQSGYESGSLSNQTYDELYCSSSYLSPDSFEDPDQEKMKLLRMVYKLQDQLNRTSNANGETNERLSTGKHISAYQSHDFHEGRFHHGLDYPSWDGSCSSYGINWRQRHNFSQIPYLAEPISSTHHVDHPCFHCCPQEWQCPGEFPPHSLYHHEELCRPHLGHSCCTSHHSYSSSPQLFMTSKLVHGRETKSCDQRHRAPETNYLREKPSLTKRHYRPVAGGAPFVTCHKCLKLLQLPADFLLFKRVCHQLKCGACQEVLKFSLQNRSHIVSYAPNDLGPPSSGLDVQNEAIDGSNPHSESHANHYHADHMSYSDDYGHSVSKSYSSEGDPVSLTPFRSSHGGAHDNPSVSPSTFEPITEKETIASRGPSTSKAPVETDELAVHTSNISMEAPLSLPKTSPLHQLMGYSSPSQVLRGIRSSLEGKQTSTNEEH